MQPWDREVTWAFSTRDDRPDRSRQEGRVLLGRAHDIIDITPAASHEQREREVILNGEVWSESSRKPQRQHCALLPGFMPGNPLPFRVASRPPGEPEDTNAPAFAITFDGDEILSVEPGQPTVVAGDPATAYVWRPAAAPWLRGELILDQRNQLRRATIHDTARGKVIEEFSADPTDVPITDPTGEPIVGPP